jgi:hypothetical protein
LKYGSFHKAWQNFAHNLLDEEGEPMYPPPYVPDTFFAYAQYLIELGYTSAKQYMMRAYDLCAMIDASKESILTQKFLLADLKNPGWGPQMDRAKARVKELIKTEIGQAKPFQLDDAYIMSPAYSVPFLIALSSGCRPKALANCTMNSVQKCETTGLIRVALADVPQDKFCESRIIRVFCTCLDADKKHVFCPLHSSPKHVPSPMLPLEKNIITAALKSCHLDTSCGYSAYSARRATACAMAQLVSKEEGKHIKSMIEDDSGFKARVNAQFGWCPKSTMVLHYCKGHTALGDRERTFYYPLYMYLRWGLTQDKIGQSFIINARGDAMPQPKQPTRALIGPSTFSDQVDTKPVPIYKRTGGSKAVIGGAADAASMDAEKTAVAESGATGAPETLQKSNRGRKKGGVNRPKEEIEAEKEQKAAKREAQAASERGRPPKNRK